jgi:hypothetical protein
MTDRAAPESPQEPVNGVQVVAPLDPQTHSNPEFSEPMLDVHAPHESVHTWRDFLVHIATICVGLLIAVALEQTIETVHHRQQREQIRLSLDHDTRATLRDANFANGEYLRRIQWSRGRIEQVQAALSSHKPLAEGAHIERSGVGVPADPAWEAAKAGGMIPLFSQGEIAAYSEIADLVSRTRPLLEAVSSASLKRSDFEARYKPISGDAASNYRLESPADLQAYLDLLIAEKSALERVRTATAFIIGAETAVLEGARDHDRILERELQTRDSLQAPSSNLR